MIEHRYHIGDRVIINPDDVQHFSKISKGLRGTVIQHDHNGGVFEIVRFDDGNSYTAHISNLQLIKCRYERNKSRKKNKNK